MIVDGLCVKAPSHPAHRNMSNELEGPPQMVSTRFAPSVGQRLARGLAQQPGCGLAEGLVQGFFPRWTMGTSALVLMWQLRLRLLKPPFLTQPAEARPSPA